MPEMNGHEANPSRLDRMEKIIGQLGDDIVKLVASQRQTDANVAKLSVDVRILHDTAVLQAQTMDHVITKLSETDDKLNALISVVESDHREFHERLKRLESVQ
jgi:hypothetical protein